MSCSTCNSVTADCRVDLPRISTLDSRGDECATVPGKIGDLGSKVFVTPYNVTYYRPGVTVREFNGPDLRLPQKRTFLGPEFYNSGCATLYGNSRFNIGPNTADTEAAGSRAMFEYSFAPQPYFQGNRVDCTNAGAKCASPNSALGWMLLPDGNLMWQQQSQNAVTGFCGAQAPLAARGNSSLMLPPAQQ